MGIRLESLTACEKTVLSDYSGIKRNIIYSGFCFGTAIFPSNMKKKQSSNADMM